MWFSWKPPLIVWSLPTGELRECCSVAFGGLTRRSRQRLHRRRHLFFTIPLTTPMRASEARQRGSFGVLETTSWRSVPSSDASVARPRHAVHAGPPGADGWDHQRGVPAAVPRADGG